MHGFPYDVHAYEEVAPRGARVIVPYLRGVGPTRFLDAATPRSGEHAALAADLRTLMDALAVQSAVLAGFDWGGRAACIMAALSPERVKGLVTQNGYNLQDIAGSSRPASPLSEWRHSYQYYFLSERGRAGLTENRRALGELLWRLWSPNWYFDDATYDRTARSFENPDFVDVVIHSYRHRHALVDGDPLLADSEAAIAKQPDIIVPTIHIDGLGDGVTSVGGSEAHARHFTGPYEFRTVPGAGHNLPQEAPVAFADAILALL